MTPPAAQAKNRFGSGLDLPVFDQIELAGAVEREHRRERIVLIDGTGKTRRSP
jgi:hypothetical protein